MKHSFFGNFLIFIFFGLFLFFTSCGTTNKLPYVESKDNLNRITLSLNEKGELFYNVTRRSEVLISDSPLGLIAEDQDFSSGLSITEISPLEERREKYSLQVGNFKDIDNLLIHRSVTLTNKEGASMIVDLVAGEEGVAFRYRFSDENNTPRVIKEEVTGFQIDQKAQGWLQPYNSAGDYTPAYEDFYFNVNAGDAIHNPRNPSVGWCMPALFNVNDTKNWILIAETDSDASFPGCHLDSNSEGGLYKVAFAKENERFTLPLEEKEHVYPTSQLPWSMPWRAIIIGDEAGDILLSSLITDLAPASKIEDTSWIKVGKASWSWWSHPDDHSPKIYNDFTDLAASFDFEYTLFDAGWEQANEEGGIIDRANAKGVKPMVWGFSGHYFDGEARRKRFKELAEMGISGVKIDFWCSDRQEVMEVLEELLEDAAKEKLMINLHGSTMPRGWHRTWPNFMTAESVLGTESYFYEPRFPDKAAEQNTVLPFTRNVAGPTDYTPFALTMREYPRLNTAVHELATAMIYTSGIIHFADSKEVFDSLPIDVKNLFKDMPATWDKTESIVANPGESIVLHRKEGALSYVIGINGTNEDLPLEFDLKKYGEGFSKYRIIKEGEDPLMEFASEVHSLEDNWSYTLAPKGGFIIQFIN